MKGGEKKREIRKRIRKTFSFRVAAVQGFLRCANCPKFGARKKAGLVLKGHASRRMLHVIRIRYDDSQLGNPHYIPARWVV